MPSPLVASEGAHPLSVFERGERVIGGLSLRAAYLMKLKGPKERGYSSYTSKKVGINSNIYRSFLCKDIPNCKFTIQPVFILEDLLILIEK